MTAVMMKNPRLLMLGLLLIGLFTVSWPAYTQSHYTGIIYFPRPTPSVNENAGQATLDIAIQGCDLPEANLNNQLSITVALDSDPGTATNGTDYQFNNPTTLNLVDENGNWQTHYSIPVSILDDNRPEGNEVANFAMTVVGVQGFLHCTGAYQHLVVTTGDYNTTQLRIIDNDTVAPLNVAINTPQNNVEISAGERVSYTSTISGGVPPYTIHWDFGGGNPAQSDQEDPGQVLYASAGTYTTTLVVTDSQNQRQTLTRQITVNAVPSALTVTMNSPANDPLIQVGNTVSYSSTVAGGTPPYHYNWTFQGGQPASSTLEDPGSVRYDSAGSFITRLVVLDSQNRSATITRTATVSADPPAYDFVLISGNNQEVTAGNTSAPLIVAVQHSQLGNISGQTVRFTVVEGNATLSSSQVITGSNGQAQTTVTPAQSGPIRVLASLDNSNKTITFTLTGKPAGTSGLLHNINGLTPTQQAVAQTIDIICPSRQASAELLARCDALIGNRVSDAEAADALSQIAPEEAIVQTSHGIEMATTQVTNIQSRLLALRSGARGFNASGLAFAWGNQALSGADLAQRAQSEKTERGGSAGDDSAINERWGVFINGRVQFGDKTATAAESGFDFDTQGITLGADYRVNNAYILGTAVGFANTSSDMNNQGGNLDAEGITWSFYGNANLSDALYLDWIAHYGWNSYESTRRFNYEESPGQFVIGSTQGDNDGSQYGVDLTLGYDTAMNSLTVGSYARLSYTHVNTDGYQETSAQNLGLNMIVGEQAINSFTTALGVRLSYAASQNWGVLVPHLLLEWEHEYRDDARFVNASFVDDFRRIVFQLPTDSPDRNYFNVGVGVSAQFSAGRSAFISYESVLEKDRVNDSTVTAGVRLSF